MAHRIPPTRGPGRGSGRGLGPGSGPAPNTGPDPDAERASDPVDARAPTAAAGLRAVPFAWQHGSRLLLLEARPLGWILAELRFDPAACHYVEVRRARYRWPREAAGALLSRALAAGDVTAERTARDLHAWLATSRQ